MLNAQEEKLAQLEMFKRNESWRRIIKKLLAAWTQYFDCMTKHKDPGNWTEELSIEGRGLLIYWHRTPSWGTQYKSPVRTVTTWLEVFDIAHRRKLLLKKRIETKVLCLHHSVDIPRDDIPKHCWRKTADLWEVYNIDFDFLAVIPGAIELVRDHLVGAAEDSAEHEVEMEVFNEFLDGAADVLAVKEE